ncbi:MAG: MFS transporter [Pseudomonadota bacterium]
MSPGLRWYLIATGCALAPAGVQLVLYPYLLVVVLEVTAVRVGIAQTAAQLPMLVLLLVGGVLGDRFEQRRLVMALHGVMALPPLLLVIVIHAGGFGYATLLAWGLASGVLAALAVAPREALLGRVAGANVQRSVNAVLGAQLTAAVAGFAAGAGAERLGVVPLLLGQAGCLAAAVAAMAGVPASRQAAQPVLPAGATALLRGAGGPAVGGAIVLAFAVGVLFGGTFTVLLPVMVRSLYDGGAFALAGAFAAPLAGAGTGVALLFRSVAVRRPARAMMVAGAAGALFVAVLALDLPAPAFHAVLGLWGCCGGICVALSRGQIQMAAPVDRRARVLALYGLGLAGGAPLGALLLGVCAELLGPRPAALVPAAGLLAVLAVLGLTRRVGPTRCVGARFLANSPRRPDVAEEQRHGRHLPPDRGLRHDHR